MEYRVAALRDGSSFSSRHIIGSQDGEPIVALTASFHRPEGEALHQAELPTVPAPEACRSGRYHSDEFESLDVSGPTDGPTTAGTGADVDGRSDPLTLHHWSRLQGAVPDDPSIIEAMVAWLSDNGPTRAGRQPHLDHPSFDRIRTTSLDHHLWFHRPAQLHRWHLTTLRSEATVDARGLVRGVLHDDEGRHIASLAQEVLVRLPPVEATGAATADQVG